MIINGNCTMKQVELYISTSNNLCYCTMELVRFVDKNMSGCVLTVGGAGMNRMLSM